MSVRVTGRPRRVNRRVRMESVSIQMGDICVIVQEQDMKVNFFYRSIFSKPQYGMLLDASVIRGEGEGKDKGGIKQRGGGYSILSSHWGLWNCTLVSMPLLNIHVQFLSCRTLCRSFT